MAKRSVPACGMTRQAINGQYRRMSAHMLLSNSRGTREVGGARGSLLRYPGSFPRIFVWVNDLVRGKDGSARTACALCLL